MDDLISRTAAIDVLSDGKELLNRVLDDIDVVGADREKYSWGLGLINSYIEDIKDLPSAQPEWKTGRWIEYDSDEDKYDVIKCPCCKHTFTVDAYHWTDIGFVKDDFKFCPNCGAYMEANHEN